MKGDFSRSTFRRASHYDGVRLQQGRVLLDAEMNELVDVQNHLRTATARDVIGAAGAPRFRDGFRVDWADGNVAFTSGRFYVDGILCENEGETIRVTPPGAPANDVILDRWSADPALLAPNRWIEVIGRDASNSRLTAFRKINAVDVNARKLTMGNVFAGFTRLDAVRTTTTYLTQPDSLKPAQTEVVAGNPRVKASAYLVWLDVWQRHITYLEDPLIREKALGGPDTTTRSKVLWQVRLEPNVADCKTFAPPLSTGRLAARDRKPSGPPKQCEISPQAGFRRLENQLYRVEIHTGGAKNAARFKWSRDNGSIVFPIEAAVAGHADQLKLRTVGRDDIIRLQPNDFVELIDDVRELDGAPGTMLRVTAPPAESDRIVTLNGPTAGLFDLTKNPRLRLWQSGETSLAGDAANQNFAALEDGVEVRFEDGNYRTGDYWLIPARTAINDETGHIEWPVDGANNPLSLPAEGIVHHFAPLATINANGVMTHDCRPLFAPITAPDLFYLSGDGQEASLTDARLPQNLEVLVSNGAPVSGATVEFRVINGGGNVSTVDGATSGATISVVTGADGKAACIWRTDFVTARQSVTARLADVESKDFVAELPPITFNAWVKYAKDVIYEPGACAFLNDTKTVQDALDKLCKRPSGGGICTLVASPDMDWAKAIRDLPPNEDAEICFRGGIYDLAEQLTLSGSRRLTFNGIGEGSRIRAASLSDALVFEGLIALIVRDLAIESGRVPQNPAATPDPNLPGVVTLRKVTEALFEDVSFACASGANPSIACLAATGCNEIRISRCDFDVGAEQDGIVLVGCERVQVESSRLAGPSFELLRPLVLREAFPQLTFAEPTAAQNIRFNLGDQRVAFAGPAAEASEWPNLAGRITNTALIGREVVSNLLAAVAVSFAAGGNPLAEQAP